MMHVEVNFSPASCGFRSAWITTDGSTVARFQYDDYENYRDYFNAVTKRRVKEERKAFASEEFK